METGFAAYVRQLFKIMSIRTVLECDQCRKEINSENTRITVKLNNCVEEGALLLNQREKDFCSKECVTKYLKEK